MAIAFDAKSQLTATNSTVDGNWTHTPVGTPAAAIVMIAQGGATTDQVVGVTYNGVAMTRIATASDSGEAERVYLYFLNTGLGTGAKTVAVDINSSSPYAATAVTVTADSGVADIDVSNFGNGTTSNPTLTLNYTDGLADWIAIVCMGEGANAVTGASIDTGTSLYENDLVSQVGMFSYIEGTGGTTQSFNTTASNASWAWCGVVLEEIVSVNSMAGLFPVVPAPFAPGNQLFLSTWNLFSGGVEEAFTDAPADIATVTAQSFDGDISLAPNADDVAVSVTTNNAAPTVASNADTTTAVVAANVAGPSVAVNAGIANITVTANAVADSLQANAGTTTVSVVSNNAASTVVPNTGSTTAVTVANDAGPSVAVNAGTVTVTVTAQDPTVLVQENHAYPRVAPIFSPLNPLAPSTWTFFSQPTEILTSVTNANAGLADVTVTSNNAAADLKPNAGTTSVTAVAGDATKTEAVNAGTTVVTVTANNGVATTAVNSGTTTASITANNAVSGVSANAGTVSVTVTANDVSKSLAVSATTTTAAVVANTAVPSVQPNAETTSVTVTANSAGPNVAVNADVAQVTVIANNVSAGGPDDLQGGPKLGPAPIFSSLNTFSPSTWNFYSQPTDIVITNANADTTSAAVVANTAGPSVQPNAGNTAVSAAVNQPGKTVAVNAGLATATVSSLQVTISGQPNAGTTSVVAVSNTGSLSIKVNAGIATVTGTAYQPTTPIAGVANAGFAVVTVAALVATAAPVDGSIHDYSGIGGLTIAGEHSGNTGTDKSGVSGATEISNSSSTIFRVEGG